MIVCVECDADYELVKKLMNCSEIIHSGNKSGVVKNLVEKYENSLGLIDEDPSSANPKALDRFIEIENNNRYGISVKRYTRKNNYIIELKPRLEEWIVHAAKLNKIKLQPYGLPEDGSYLHSVITSKIPNYCRLLDDLMINCDHVKFLQNKFTSFCE